MNDSTYHTMLEATRLTRAGQLAEATALLQRSLRGETTPHTPSDPTSGTPGARSSRVIDVMPDEIETVEVLPSPNLKLASMSAPGERISDPSEGRAEPALRQALRSFLGRINRLGSVTGLRGQQGPLPVQAPELIPDDDGQFVTKSFSNETGGRAYKLYIPAGYHGEAVPLIIMLHGCTQSPDDFAAGTGMNTLAEENTFLVAYPEQTASANASKCWNWFSPSDQQRDLGEPSLIAGITRQIMRDYAVDARRVYVAGLSAGGAAAAIMGAAYPDLYAAVGVHSGLACGAAHDLPSAFAAMRQGGVGPAHSRGVSETEEAARNIPTIVFHGDWDGTVHPRNGDQVIAQAGAISAVGVQRRVEHGRTPGGHAYSRTSFTAATGKRIREQWVVHGAGHAWSGGSPAGSYTDPLGPDAAREMVRFFLENSRHKGEH